MRDETTVQVSIGFASLIGSRPQNQDFAGACLVEPGQRAEMGVAVALSDGMGGAKGGREAAELSVRGFLDGYYEQPPTLGVQRAASHVINCLNSWLVTQGRVDQSLLGMGATFTSLIVKGRNAHVLHVGDSRLYRFSDGRLTLLTEDHALKQPGLNHILYRALGIEQMVRLDYAVHPVAEYDRFLLTSDGVHGVLSDATIAEVLGRRASSDETAQDLVAQAVSEGGTDNATALIVDIISLPPPDRDGIGRLITVLPIVPMPQVGNTIDGFKLEGVISDGHYSRLFKAWDRETKNWVAIKFPHPSVTTEATYKSAFIREAWVAARVRSPFVASVIERAESQQSCLYTLMPFYDGETLEHRLMRHPIIGLTEGIGIAIKLSKAVEALHRAGLVHRDIKPENILLEHKGGLRLLDLGVVRVPGMEEFGVTDIPGTPSYMAPEMFDGHAGDQRTDLYAVGATLYRLFTMAFPQGEIEPFSRPRFAKAPSLSTLRRDLPVWLDDLIGRALSLDPNKRPQDMSEFLWELESGPVQGSTAHRHTLSFYDRNPLLFWKVISALLSLALLIALQHR